MATSLPLSWGIRQGIQLPKEALALALYEESDQNSGNRLRSMSTVKGQEGSSTQTLSVKGVLYP